jgi:hypothetical protein
MSELNQGDLDLLRRLAGAMIPPDPAHGAPGADDPAVFQEIAAGLQPRAALLAPLVSDLAAGALADASTDALDALRRTHGAAFAVLIAATAQAYYRDDRVMRALGMEVRPPFPGGHEIIEGDWALLDAVRERPPIWRAAD